MCGITGYIDFTSSTSAETLKRMTQSLVHRGPDDEGIEILDRSGFTVGLGFRRLAILDLSPAGHQPMQDKHTQNWIVFNGEIYNFKEIRSELEKDGDRFHSSGDTEVILAAYRKWGLKCVDRFIGMFAIAIYDHQKQKLVCFRDRAGVKPFFYYWDGNLFLFGSELKAFHQHPSFLKKINENALSYYFQHGCITAPYTIFENTFKIIPGHSIELDLKSKKIQNTEYWNVTNAYAQPVFDLSYEEAKDKLEGLFIAAFRYRMISDVPVGVFLSGGYDSSCVAAILQAHSTNKIKTFTIGFDRKEYNEAPHAKAVADHLGTEHHEHLCTFKEAMDFIPMLPQIYDEPFGDSSAIPTLLVSKMARKEVTVALSADGGDELFAGYPRHRKSFKYISGNKKIPTILKKPASEVIKALSSSDGVEDVQGKLSELLAANGIPQMFDVINRTFSQREVNDLLNRKSDLLHSPYNNSYKKGTGILSQILSVEYQAYLADDILQKVDRATMSVSLEGREPFLDHQLVEFISRLPDHFKMDTKNQKIILKDIVHKYIPKEIMERPKMGFGVPVSFWLKAELKDLFMEYLSDTAIKSNPYLNHSFTIKLRDLYMNDKLKNFERIWFVFTFQMWYKKWMTSN